MNKEDIENEVKKGLTIYQIAQYFNCSCSTIRYWLKKYFLKTKNTITRKSWTDEQLYVAVKESTSIRQIIIKLGLQPRPGNYPTIKRRMKELNIDTTHLLGKSHGTGGFKKVTLDKMLVENSLFCRKAIKIKLIKYSIIPYECSECHNKGEWKDKKLVLVLDHINGINDDYRIDNLRFLCPNCNSQQSTFCGKGKKVYKICIQCGNKKNYKSPSGLCFKCRGLNDRKVKRPTPEELKNLIITSNFSEIGRKFGVTDNAVRNWAKYYNII